MTSALGTWTLELEIRSRVSYHLYYGNVGVSRKIFNTWDSASTKQYDIQVKVPDGGVGGGQLEKTTHFVRILGIGSLH